MPFSLSTLSQLERKTPRETRWLRLLAALSLGNLCYLRIWDSILYNPERDYLAATPLRSMDYIAAVIGVMCFALLAYGAIRCALHGQRRWLRAIGVGGWGALVLLPLDFLRRTQGWALGSNMLAVTCGLVAGGLWLLLAWILVWRPRMLSVPLVAFTLVSPYVVMTFGTALYRAIQVAAISAPPSRVEAAPANGYKAQHRVVFVIFDEWDYAALFDHHPPELALPHLDALVKQSVLATNAWPPAGRTMLSIPALLAGVRVSEAKAAGDSELSFREHAEGPWRSFSSTDTFVSRAIGDGKRVEVLGWYHPYGRLFARSANLSAAGWGYPDVDAYRGSTVAACLFRQGGYLLFPLYMRMAQAAIYSETHRIAIAATADPSMDLVYIHYNVPHLPGIYSARNQGLSLALTSNQQGYQENLALADRSLGELLRALDTTGLRGNTSLIFTSDHWFRHASWMSSNPSYRIPLLVRAADGTVALRHDTPFCTVDLRGLVEEMLAGRITTNAQVAAWLNQPHGPVPIGYEKGSPIWPK